MASTDRGCHVCCYSKDCPDPVKLNYGLTLVGHESYKLCQAFQVVGDRKPSDVLTELSKGIKLLHTNLFYNDRL